MKILLVDDDEDDRYLFGIVLPKINIHLDALHDGEDIVHFLHCCGPLPDYIFLDLRMIRTDGMDCLVRIKSDNYLREIPIIILSGSPNPMHIEQAYQKGANLYISKPSNEQDLRNAIEKVLAFEKAHFVPQAVRRDFFVNDYLGLGY